MKKAILGTLQVLCAFVVPAFASVTVSSPANGARETSPFKLTASATACSSQAVSAMGYSLDSSTDTTIVNGTSISASVPAATGGHTVHVKSWGSKGASCIADVSVDVTGQSNSSTSTSSASADGITISSPGNHATVGTQFTLSAGASSCSGQAVGSMGYSLDSTTNTTVAKGTVIGATITSAAGSHTLHVKSWGNGGAGCDANVALNVVSAVATAAFSTSVGGITLSAPGNGASVSSPFSVVASAGTCSGQPVSAMGYSLDKSTGTSTFSGTQLNTHVSAGTGSHTLHVKSWGIKGAGCVANLAVNVTGSSGPYVPSTAITVSSLQTHSNWKDHYDTATSGGGSGYMSLTGSPSLSGNARKFVTKYTNGGGVLYYVSFGDDTARQNFVYDAEIYLTSSYNEIANIEMDMNQVMANGRTVIYGFQCDGYSRTWDFTKNAGSATAPRDTWVHSSAGCDPRNWAPNRWHHVQISYSRDKYGNVTYHSVWLDGTQHPIGKTVFSAFALHWAPSLIANFQIDGLGSSGAPVVYVDALKVHRW